MPRFSLTKPKTWSMSKMLSFGKASNSCSGTFKVRSPSKVDQAEVSAKEPRRGSSAFSIGDLDDLDVLDVASTNLHRSASAHLPTYCPSVELDACNTHEDDNNVTTLFEFPESVENERVSENERCSPVQSSCVTSLNLYCSSASSTNSLDSLCSSIEEDDIDSMGHTKNEQEDTATEPSTTGDLHALAPVDLVAKHASLQRAMRYAEAQVVAAHEKATSMMQAERPDVGNAGPCVPSDDLFLRFRAFLKCSLSEVDTDSDIYCDTGLLGHFGSFEVMEAVLAYRDAQSNVDAIRARLAAVEDQAIAVACRLDCWPSMMEDTSTSDSLSAHDAGDEKVGEMHSPQSLAAQAVKVEHFTEVSLDTEQETMEKEAMDADLAAFQGPQSMVMAW